ARAIEPRRRWAPSTAVGARVDDRIQIEVLPVLEAAQRTIHGRPDALELPAHLGDQAHVVRHRACEELPSVPRELALVEPAPAAPVVTDQLVPFVVEIAGIGVLTAADRAGPPPGDRGPRRPP